jgi:hypothetical protein
MHFGVRDIVLTLISILLILTLSVLTAQYLSEWVDFVFGRYGPTVTVILFTLLVFFYAGLYPRLLRLIFPYREGVFPVDSSGYMTFWKYHQFTYDWTMSILGYILPVGTRRAFYKFLGAKLGKGVMIGGKLIEPPLIEMGDYSFAGENSVLTAHAIESGSVTLDRIVIGRHVTIGVMAIIFPGVHIGDGAMVAAGAVVTKGTKIGPGEIWGGIPARKIGTRTVP